MAHRVETMAYTNEVPWHGLGVHVAEAPSVDEMLKVAQLDWRVAKKPLLLETGDVVPRFNALVRESDGRVLTVVGSQYTPVQNTEAFAFFKEFVEAGDATMETAGSLCGGRFVWGLADLKQSFNVNGGDPVKGYLLVVAPHESGHSLIIRQTSVRVVCWNTMTLALGAKVAAEFRMAHRTRFDETMMARAKEVLGLARERTAEFAANARALKQIPMTTDQVVEFCVKLFGDADRAAEIAAEFEEKASPTVKRLVDVYEHAPGADPGTAWGAFNAVTYYADHVASKTSDARLTSAWLGRMAVKKQEALEMLLAAA